MLIREHGPIVSKALSRAGAQLERAGVVYNGLSLAEWSNRNSRAGYDHPQHHTLSLYLEGGFQVVREESPSSRGAPDKICLLPAGHESRWIIGGSMRMFHLYVEPEQLAYRALTGFDIDPRRIDLKLAFGRTPKGMPWERKSSRQPFRREERPVVVEERALVHLHPYRSVQAIRPNREPKVIPRSGDEFPCEAVPRFGDDRAQVVAFDYSTVLDNDGRSQS